MDITPPRETIAPRETTLLDIRRLGLSESEAYVLLAREQLRTVLGPWVVQAGERVGVQERWLALGRVLSPVAWTDLTVSGDSAAWVYLGDTEAPARIEAEVDKFHRFPAPTEPGLRLRTGHVPSAQRCHAHGVAVTSPLRTGLELLAACGDAFSGPMPDEVVDTVRRLVAFQLPSPGRTPPTAALDGLSRGRRFAARSRWAQAFR